MTVDMVLQVVQMILVFGLGYFISTSGRAALRTLVKEQGTVIATLLEDADDDQSYIQELKNTIEELEQAEHEIELDISLEDDDED